ncbi:glycoside hydrolase N-terminal domain-containing protein [Paenibacillus yanchengensis]|uniref:Glycoside hydrolase N-terminal domain-containing protein n=1 Tax=Paenibacillus yanchengensis TaxID=2035833 RepID=A0ABW4YGG5_9BACL
MKQPWKLWYEQAAEQWVEALPLGNGHLGGMVHGGIKYERISLNEDTLWSGSPRQADNPAAFTHLDESRRLIFAGKYSEAQQLIEQHMLGPWTHAYQAMGDLHIQFAQHSVVTSYRRELDLQTAIATTQFVQNGLTYTREVFISAVDQVMVVHITVDQPGKIDLGASLTSVLNYKTYKATNDRVVLEGQAPSYIEPIFQKGEPSVFYEDEQGIRFQIHLQAMVDGGYAETHGANLVVGSANSVTLLLSAATSFNGFDKNPVKEGKDAASICEQRLQEASKYNYETLRERHIADHASYFARVDLQLGDSDYIREPTDRRIEAVKDGREDSQLAALFFQFGRYLMISSSRPGSQATNLQGIWNNMTKPPWSCNYTTNINTEMNYWPAEPCNLAEFHTPLFDLIDDLRISGARMAKHYYNCRGWTAHHGVDLWRSATPQSGSASWSFWPMTAAWFCQHIWEHYAYSGDKQFLQDRAYPAMLEAVQFYIDFLVEDEQGNLVTIPSTSPENTFIAEDGSRSAVSMSSTMDVTLLHELFGNYIQASDILNVDEAFREQVKQAKSKLLPLKIGKHGQLQEWFQDFEEAEPEHRHTAHLYGLHPGNMITLRGTPELAEAAKTSLARRQRYEGQDTIGWCFAWNINFYARLEEPERAYEYVTKLLANPYPNLFNAHRHRKISFYPFSIEANFAGTAGIAEMLVQSHSNEIHLLPSLPKAWAEGTIRGLRARGGYELDLTWSDGQITEVRIRSSQQDVCTIRSVAFLISDDITVEQVGEHVYRFQAEANQTYCLYTKK